MSGSAPPPRIGKFAGAPSRQPAPAKKVKRRLSARKPKVPLMRRSPGLINQ